jgi:Tol biopolymer transport system component
MPFSDGSSRINPVRFATRLLHWGAMTFWRPLLLLSFVSLLALPRPAHAILNSSVRTDRFNWMQVQTDHFDIFFDSASEKAVPIMARHLEDAWKEVGDVLNVKVAERTPFFFYSNHNEFEQTNIVPVGEGTGGVTEAFKNRFLIYNDGSQMWMRHVIFHEFAHVVQFNVLYGGFWKSIRLLKSPFYPLWLMEGMAEYSSVGIDAPLGDMVVRDAVFTKTLIGLPELQGFGHLKPNQITLGYKTGEAAMEFLADEYGKDKVARMLDTIESHFDVSAALEEMLGTDLFRFDFRFREWLEEKYEPVFAASKIPPFYGTKLTKSDKIPQTNESPAFSPDGKSIYYFSDRGGPTEIFRYDVESKRARKLISLKWSKFENLHSQARALSVSRDGRWLAFAGERVQSDYLYLYDLRERDLLKVKVPFDQIRSPVFSPTSDEIVCVGMQDGFNDIYVIDRDGRLRARLTDNPQDERDAIFSPDGKTIVYSGEVLDETGKPVGRDLFKISRDGGAAARLTQYPGDEADAEVLPDGSIIFVRDHADDGSLGYDLYQMAPGSTTSHRLTRMVGGAFSPRYAPATKQMVYVGFHAGERHLYDLDAAHYRAPSASVGSIEPSPLDNDRSDPPLSDRARAATYAMQTWPEGLSTPLVLGQAKPYKLKGSTDLFLPFFFYSTLDGLVAADVWQLSDYLGNHQIQQQMQYASGSDYVDFALFYTYAGLRPDLTVGFRSQKYYRDVEKEHQRRDVNAVAIMTYPLDRVNSVTAGVGASDRRDTFLDFSEVDNEKLERFVVAGYAHDTVTGRYLVPTKGRRLSLLYQQSFDTAGGNQAYKSGAVEGVNYLPLPGESTFASRLFYARSVGPNPQEFRLGGVDRVRALSSGSDENKRGNVVVGSAEARLRLKYLDARTKFLFPDFFFKAAYLILFDDAGYGWDTHAERDAFSVDKLSNSAGVGLSWPTFIMQTFQLNFTVQWAKRTDTGGEVWYITIAPTF